MTKIPKGYNPFDIKNSFWFFCPLLVFQERSTPSLVLRSRQRGKPANDMKWGNNYLWLTTVSSIRLLVQLQHKSREEHQQRHKTLTSRCWCSISTRLRRTPTTAWNTS
jgi:hypothetical protein